MVKFTTRVELHNTNSDEDYYETLHDAMIEEGFSRTIFSFDDIEYHLPPAEYNLIADLTAEAVRDKAARAAKKTKRPYSILVTGPDGRVWEGLKKVTR